MSDATPRPKPTPPKRPLTVTDQEVEELFSTIFKNGEGFIDTAAKPASVLVTKTPKPVYILRPHLTEKPFRGHEGLQALQKQMSTPTKAPSRNKKEKK